MLDYTESARRHGLNLVCTPGNDVAEFCSHLRHLVHQVPAGVSWERLAMVEPLTISVHAVKRARTVRYRVNIW